jgi:2'-5' RNA ligase
MNEALVCLGLAPADKSWSPHLTVARVKAAPPAALRHLLSDARVRSFGVARVASVELMRSELRPEGARHQVNESVVLPT